MWAIMMEIENKIRLLRKSNLPQEIIDAQVSYLREVISEVEMIIEMTNTR